MFVVREVRPSDVDAILRLAALLDSVNLPADRGEIERLVDRSTASFNATIPVENRKYLFALVELPDDRPLGVAMVIAAHGTPLDPHHLLELDFEERYSRTLDRLFRHPTLRFRQSFTPHTEIGALVLGLEQRGHPLKLGKLLSFARFLYIGAHRDRFQATVQAELLPPFEPDGTSRLWNWLGRPFTGLEYQDADRLSRHQHEFMETLFPRHPLYVELMPAPVREVLGAVGESSRGVAKMLTTVGFQFNRCIDPFDGGPHFAAATDEISIVAGLHSGRAAVRNDLQPRSPNSQPADSADDPVIGLIARLDPKGSAATIAAGPLRLVEGAIETDAALLDAIGAVEGDSVIAAPYPQGDR